MAKTPKDLDQILRWFAEGQNLPRVPHDKTEESAKEIQMHRLSGERPALSEAVGMDGLLQRARAASQRWKENRAIAGGTPTQTSASVDDEGRAEGGSSTNVHSFHRGTSKAPKSKNGQEPIVEPGAREYRAAAAPVGEEKARALPKALMSKTPLGEAEGAKGTCLFYAMEDVVFVAFERGEPPARISLRGLPVEKYALSLKADADGHYEIFGIKATEVAQFLALRRKLRW